MEEQKVINRWLVVVGALLIQVSLGRHLHLQRLQARAQGPFPDWSATDLALPSQLVLAFFALAMIFVGRIQDKIGPRIVATPGRRSCSARGSSSRASPRACRRFVLGFSILGGIGIGAAYVCPIATCVKWFPDKRGLITGLAVAGFGAGGLVFTPVAKSLIASSGVMNTFLYLGIIFLVAVIIGAQFMKQPARGLQARGLEPARSGRPGPRPVRVDYTWQQMLKTPQFWLLWLTYFAGCTAGLLVIMNIDQRLAVLLDPGGRARGPRRPKETVRRHRSAGATAVIVVAILNAARPHRLGQDLRQHRPQADALHHVPQRAASSCSRSTGCRTYPLFLFGVASVGFCFGGFLALFPAVTADYFGTKNVGVNYGWMFTAYGAGGLFGPWLAPKLMSIVQKVPYETLDKAGAIVTKPSTRASYLKAFVISSVLCFAAAAVIAIVRPAGKASGKAAGA